MKKELFVLITSVCHNILAQETSNVGLEIRKIIVEQSFFERYRFDVGADYNHKIGNKYYVGGSLNIAYSKLYSDGDYGNDTKTFIIRPRINIGYLLNSTHRINFVPKIGIGYSIIYMKSKKNSFIDYQYGINGFFELKINYNTKMRLDPFFVSSYDYIYLKKDEDFSKLNYYRNIHLVNFGIGTKLKFYKKDE